MVAKSLILLGSVWSQEEAAGARVLGLIDPYQPTSGTLSSRFLLCQS